MRSFGAALILVGALGFFYCSAKLSKMDPAPPDKTGIEILEYPAGRMELGRYAGAFVGFVGLLMALYPKGR